MAERDMAERADTLIRFLLPEAHSRGAIIRAGHIVGEGARLHGLADEPAGLFGQALIASILLLSISKGGIRQVLQLDASPAHPEAPIQRLLVEARAGEVRGYLNWQEQHTAMREAHGAGMRAWMGSDVRLSTVRDLGFGQPYISTIAHDSDYLADYLVHYLAQSVQVHADIILFGDLGIMIEAMPGADEEHWFAAVSAMAAIPDEALGSRSPAALLEHFAGLGCKVVGEDTYAYVCHCSPETMAAALLQMGAEHLEGLADDAGRITVTCQYAVEAPTE